MIVKKVKDRKKRGIERTSAYIADAKHAAPNATFGEKVQFSGTLNTLSDNFKEATQEISALTACYKKESDATSAHWIISLQEGDSFTQESATDAAKTLLKHLGMQDHPAIYTVHKDKKNPHLHICFSRVSPEPDHNGEYNVVWRGSTIESKNGNNEVASGHVAIAELSAKYGWKQEENARYIWKDGQYSRNQHAKQDNDQIKMGQRIETWEARNGIKHPKRILAESAMEAIRSANNDKSAAVAALAAAGIQYSDVDYIDNKGRRHCGGKLQGPGGEEVKLSALPKDCRYLAKLPTTQQPQISTEKASQIYTEITTHGGAKKYIKQAIAESGSGAEFFQKLEQKNLKFEKTGKAGGRVRYGTKDTDLIKLSECGASFSQLAQKFNDFSDYAEKMQYNQEKVNGKSGRDATGGGKDATNIHESSIETLTRAVFTEAKTTKEMEKMLSEQGITFSREKATDQKTGRVFEYGKLTRGTEAITLKSLGLNENGKALFSLQGIDRVFLARDAASVVSTARSWSEAETSLANVGIKYARVKTTTATGQEVIVGRLERAGVTSSLGLAGKDFQPGALDARLLPYSEAKSLYEAARTQQNPVVFLAKQGLTVSDIDRIGRVGEKLEPNLKKQDKPGKAQGPQSQAPRPESSIIPRNINEILNLIEESAKHAAALAAANAKAGQAAWEARAAENRAASAEKALADLKASIKPETPAPTVAAAKEKTMSETTHAPTAATVPAGGMSEAEKERERLQNSEKMMMEKDREREKEKERMQREREKARQRQ